MGSQFFRGQGRGKVFEKVGHQGQGGATGATGARRGNRGKEGPRAMGRGHPAEGRAKPALGTTHHTKGHAKPLFSFKG